MTIDITKKYKIIYNIRNPFNKMNIDINKSIQIIKDFKPLKTPIFNGNEDSFRFILWNLYYRVYEATKSFIVLFENKRYYDSFIIAGHCLETCAILSYVKDNPTIELCKERYNKYLASATLGRLKATLELTNNLETDISWKNFCALLEVFYPIGVSIVKDKEKTKLKHEEAIKQINYRLGLNKDKISLFNKYYTKIKVRDYIKTFIENTSFIGGEEFNRFYIKYCNLKHGNMMTPGSSFEDNQFEDFAEDGILLILGILFYLQQTDFSCFK